MKSPVSLIVLAAWATPVQAQEPPPSDSPQGSSQVAAGEARYDAVGYAGSADAPGVAAVTEASGAGGYLEVTALDTGRTIVVAVVAGAPGNDAIVALSPAARAALSIGTERAAVRVRRVVPSAQDIAMLRAGQTANPRSDAPEVLLIPLRRKLAAPPIAPAAQATPKPPATVKPPAPLPPKKPTPAKRGETGSYVVQVAALSNAGRAQALARQLGGTVTPAGSLYRVQIGPFADTTAADRARARAVAAGYPDARRQRVGTR